MKPLTVYVGELMHQRHDDKPYRFSYPYAVVCVDVDTWQAQCQQTGVKTNTVGLFSLYHQDFGDRNGTPWRDWLSALLSKHDCHEPIHRAELVAVPRFLGIGFNPLAMWYVYNTDNQLMAVIAEVSNTFGQWHHYVHHQQGKMLEANQAFGADKVFHVSPFLPMNLSYTFKVQAPNDHYRVIIEENDALDQRVLTAVHTGKRCQDSRLVRCLWQQGLTSVGVLFGIHWHAFKLWRQKARFFKTPAPLNHVPHSDSRMTIKG